MATRTSSQSGNFNSTSTWGGNAVPVDGDAFVVSAGHIVTVNDDRRTTNGYDNSTINGKLHITGSGLIRMNGQLDVTSTGTSDYFTENNSSTGAYFRMDNGAILEIKGNNSANHSLRVNNQKYNWVEIEGTNPNTTTTTSANVTIGSSSFTVTSATGLAVGDWINVFRPLEDVDDWEYDRYQDEGMIIHDMSGSTIYPRWFVSPTATISRVSGTRVFVDDAVVFRKGQQVIFGTGSNRNIRTISEVRRNANVLVLNSAPTGTVTGEKIYRCGTEKYHLSGHTVQKIATPLTADSNSGTNTITVASTAGMSVGDRILIEANNNDDRNWDYEMRYEISAISGNTITLTSNLGNNRYTGGWVTIFDRDTQIRAATIEADGEASTSEDRPYIYFLRWTSGDAYYRRYRIRNCLFEGIGSNTTNTTWYRGLGWNGYCSYENSSYGQYASGYEGNVWVPNNSGNNACMYTRECHQCTVRNNVFYNGALNLWRYSSGNNYAINNNISWRSHYTTFLQDGAYEPRMTIDYNHFSRSDDYGALWYHHRQSAGQVRHNYWTHHEQRPLYIFYHSHNVIWENNYVNWFRSWPYIGAGGDFIHLNSYFGNDWDATTGNTSPVNGVQIQQLGDLRADRGNAAQSMYSINHNWRDGDTAEWGSYIWRSWDFDEDAWKVFRDTATDGPAGLTESIYVPAGTTCYLAAEIKLSDGFSGTYPYLLCRQANSYHDGRHYDNSTTSTQASETTNSYYYGFRESAQFTSAAIGAYERKTVTVNPVDYDYYLSVTLYTSSVNAGDGLEHWHQKPIEMYLDGGTRLKEKKFIVRHQSRRGFNQSTTRRKKRLGGRLV